MDPNKVFKVLSVETNRLIMQIIDKPKTAMEIFKEVKERTQIKNRESVYKALEHLRETGLVKKFYDEEKKGIYYKRKADSISYSTKSGEISG